MERHDRHHEFCLETLREILHIPRLALLRVLPAGGGSINTTYKLETTSGNFFVKENSAKDYPGMFEAEKKGLQLLASANQFVVPCIIAQKEIEESSFLILEWLERDIVSSERWFEAGVLLGKQHRIHEKMFGLEFDNYIGSLKQSNGKKNSWEDFFANERILPQVKMARDTGNVNSTLVTKAESFCSRIAEIFPEEQPALLHGDLWSGNFFHSVMGPAVFDPAVYFGHREMDLAMTKLFGGFDAEFYSGYENEFPPEKNWKQRVDFCNLYPLLVHVNLFGGGYVEDVKGVLRKF